MSDRVYSIEDIQNNISPIARRHGVDRVYQNHAFLDHLQKDRVLVYDRV